MLSPMVQLLNLSNYDEQSRYLKILSGKRSVAEEPVSQSFWSLLKGTINFNFYSNEPSPKVLEPLAQYDHPWKTIK